LKSIGIGTGEGGGRGKVWYASSYLKNKIKALVGGLWRLC